MEQRMVLIRKTEDHKLKFIEVLRRDIVQVDIQAEPFIRYHNRIELLGVDVLEKVDEVDSPLSSVSIQTQPGREVVPRSHLRHRTVDVS